jgi:antitoxin component YwqK of YwqJK toxin-antitoxin module
MPTLRIGEDYLCHVMGFKNHNSLFPSSGSIAIKFNKELANFTVSKGTIHFDLEKPFPKSLLKKILLARLNQINESYPRKNGRFVEYYKNGGIKAEGKYQTNKMYGQWQFFRQDGSLMRSGGFNNGKQIGVWITFDAKGKKVKETKFK